MTINIIFPVLNERLRLETGIKNTVNYLEEIGFENYKLTIIDNGSTDETPEIAVKLCERYKNVEYIALTEKGVGIAFRTGVSKNTSDIVGYMDIDLSTNIKHLGEAINLFKEQPDLEYINGSRFAKESNTKGRMWYRKLSSQGLLILLKLLLQMKCTDAICGFTFVRKEVAENLVKIASDDNGWFYMIEFLLRAERANVNILDYPVEWNEDYNTTVKFFKTICNYLGKITKLFIEFHMTFLKFLIVGVSNTILGAILMLLFYNAFQLGYWGSSALSYFIASIWSFFFNKHFTFNNKDSIIKTAVKFTINVIVCYCLAYSIAKPAVGSVLGLTSLSKGIIDQCAMMAGMVLFTLINYFGQRYFAFKEK